MEVEAQEVHGTVRDWFGPPETFLNYPVDVPKREMCVRVYWKLVNDFVNFRIHEKEMPLYTEEEVFVKSLTHQFDGSEQFTQHCDEIIERHKNRRPTGSLTQADYDAFCRTTAAQEEYAHISRIREQRQLLEIEQAEFELAQMRSQMRPAEFLPATFGALSLEAQRRNWEHELQSDGILSTFREEVAQSRGIRLDSVTSTASSAVAPRTLEEFDIATSTEHDADSVQTGSSFEVVSSTGQSHTTGDGFKVVGAREALRVSVPPGMFPTPR
jgi:hypothetical protein